MHTLNGFTFIIQHRCEFMWWPSTWNKITYTQYTNIKIFKSILINKNLCKFHYKRFYNIWDLKIHIYQHWGECKNNILIFALFFAFICFPLSFGLFIIYFSLNTLKLLNNNETNRKYMTFMSNKGVLTTAYTWIMYKHFVSSSLHPYIKLLVFIY